MDLGYFPDLRWTKFGALDIPVIESVPLLSVEILRPKDTNGDTNEKLGEYLKAGVRLIWLVSPSSRTVLVHRPDAEPVLFNVQQELSADPHLPGFRIPVAQIFTR
jgi:Uma2 family endonuclease